MRWWAGGLGLLVVSAGFLAVMLAQEPPTPAVPMRVDDRPVVAVARAERGTLTQWTFARGIAEAVRKSYLHIEVAGIVAEIGRDERGKSLREGSFVHGPKPHGQSGQMLLRLDGRDARARLAQAAAERQRVERRVEVAQATFDQARQEHERTSALASRGISSRKAAETAEAAFRTAEAELKAARAEVELATAQLRQAEIVLEKMVIRAPFDGRLSLINVRVGDYVEGAVAGPPASRERTAAAVLVDDDVLEITLNVPWPDAKDLVPGQKVLASGNAEAIWEATTEGTDHPDVVSGNIWSVSPSIGLGSRAVQVKVRVRGGTIKDGMLATVWIAAGQVENELLLPQSAIVVSEGKPFVFTVQPGSTTVDKRQVEVGLKDHIRVAIRSGVEDGDLVVTNGQHLLDGGMIVQVADQNPSEAGNLSLAAGAGNTSALERQR
ncbi:RND family efflux transporter MFP subunit [Nitratireductor aquibiodomus RA22]|uniref:RND family efflux transporter MFP subunit n=1 Tax=Nitratireductor aquibiodomus RA22 TaxID=1189611 RepID=I5BSW1_9HYPH|nr:RND family efflux transporter MFP subunit [Nitratireductor aquibiodomus RA22]